MADSAKKYRQSLREIGSFYTDPKLAECIKAEVECLEEAYDPTCGIGNLLAVFPDDCRKYGQEIDPSALDVAKDRLVNFTGVLGNTLTSPAFIDRKFKSIVANYPFSVKWAPQTDERFSVLPTLPPPSKADWAFIAHCYHMLADGGTASILCFPGALYRGNREAAIREWFVKNNTVSKVVLFDGGYFEDTKISTELLVLKKGKKSDGIIFVDSRKRLEREVPVSEVVENGSTLSVSMYVTSEPEPKEEINPWQLEQQCRHAMKEKLKNDIAQSQMVCAMEGWELNSFLDELQSVIDGFR